MLKALKKIRVFQPGFKKLAMLFSIALILTAAVGTSLSFLSAKTPSLSNVFVSGLNPAGNLVIQKTVEHPFGAAYILPDDLKFTFRVDLGEENAGKSFDNWTADENGVLLVCVNANSMVTIQGIEPETHVTVTEQSLGTGFSVKGDITKELVIEKGKTSYAAFINTYQPQKVANAGLKVLGTKKLTGRDWQEGDHFKMCIRDSL